MTENDLTVLRERVRDAWHRTCAVHGHTVPRQQAIPPVDLARLLFDVQYALHQFAALTREQAAAGRSRPTLRDLERIVIPDRARAAGG